MIDRVRGNFVVTQLQHYKNNILVGLMLDTMVLVLVKRRSNTCHVLRMVTRQTPSPGETEAVSVRAGLEVLTRPRRGDVPGSVLPGIEE